METNLNNEKLIENAKLASKWSTEALASMMDLYKKQFTIVSDFYSSIFNTINSTQKDEFNPAKNITDLFFNNAAFKSFTPFSSTGVFGGFTNPFNNMFNQMKEFNQNMLNNFSKQFGIHETSAGSISDKYQKTVEKEIDASKAFILSSIDSYNHQMEFSLNESKKIQEEINNQLKTVFDANQKFWLELFNSNYTQNNSEK